MCIFLAACSSLDPKVGDVQTESAPDAGGDAVDFGRDIRPLMNRSADDPSGHGCKACHYSTEPTHIGIDEGGLDLTTLGTLRLGGVTSGAKIIDVASPDDSAMYQKLEGTYEYGAHMPKDGPPFWSDDDIELVDKWIAQGAKGDDSE